MSLPNSWVERLFARMAVRYGTGWTMLWTGIDPEAVKADWAEVLDRMQPESLSYALGFLPERPPTATQFLEICRRAPDRTPKPMQIEGPLADPARVAAELARLRGIQKVGPKAWAYRLRDREAAQPPKSRATFTNHILTKAQRDMWREALGFEPGTPIQNTLSQHQGEPA